MCKSVCELFTPDFLQKTNNCVGCKEKKELYLNVVEIYYMNCERPDWQKNLWLFLIGIKKKENLGSENIYKNAKLCDLVIGVDDNSLYLNNVREEIPFGKEKCSDLDKKGIKNSAIY